MGGGVALAIRQRGGETIESEAMTRAPIAIGEAVITTSGSLPCSAVIHAPTMVRGSEATTVKKVGQATFAALEAADRAGFRTIAFPGMGTGVGRISPKDAARIMIQKIRNFPSEALKEVRLVAYDAELMEAFREALSCNVANR